MLAYFKPTMQPFFEIILDDKGQLLPLSRGRPCLSAFWAERGKSSSRE